MSRIFSILFLLSVPLFAQAWWNEEWVYRMPITIDTTKAGGTLAETQRQVPVLVRLHAGNFDDFFIVQESLSDLRFVSEDDKIPLEFQVDHFDLVSQVLLIWVMVPEIGPDKLTKFFMYYGNEKAATAQKQPGMYDANTALAVHFSDKQGGLIDATANKTPISFQAGEISPAGMIGQAGKFTPSTQWVAQNAGALHWTDASGGALSFWLKVPANSQGRIVTYGSANGQLRVDIANGALDVHFGTAKLTAPNSVAQDQWQLISLTAGNGQLQLAVNGKMLAQAALSSVESAGNLIFGLEGGVPGFSGEIDEISLYAKAMPLTFFEFLGKNQGINDTFVKNTPSEQLGAGGEGDVIKVIINSMDHITWAVVIGLGFMLVIGWIIMVAKWLYLRSVNKSNRDFLREYEKLGNRNPALLDYDLEANPDEYADMGPMIQAIFGRQDHYQSSPIFHLFHRGMKEVKGRTGVALSSDAVKILAPQAVNSIRAALDAQMTREIQAMQSKMTFLTMSVSGGPFIGLFGTVAGVMVTFGAIAASGEVNINAIAPGVSGALVATVGGLLVAIPAMFGYNYLSGIIKDSIADMRVFSDEYIAKLAEYYGE